VGKKEEGGCDRTGNQSSEGPQTIRDGALSYKKLVATKEVLCKDEEVRKSPPRNNEDTVTQKQGASFVGIEAGRKLDKEIYAIPEKRMNHRIDK